MLRSDCEPVAGKSTLNRLEHTPKRYGAKYHKIDCIGSRVDSLFVDPCLEAHKRAPRQIVLDLDATDIPLHGRQEGRFFHGYYDHYCYLPLYVFCARHLLLARERRSNIDASAGACEEIARIVQQIRGRWPRVHIILRADSGFAREGLHSRQRSSRHVRPLLRTRRSGEPHGRTLTHGNVRDAFYADHLSDAALEWLVNNKVIKHEDRNDAPRFERTLATS